MKTEVDKIETETELQRVRVFKFLVHRTRIRFAVIKYEIKNKSSVAGTRTRVSRVRAEYPNQLDYDGFVNGHT